jgi:hypothetical protein
MQLKAKINDEKFNRIFEFSYNNSRKYIAFLTLNIFFIGVMSSYLWTSLTFNEELPFVKGTENQRINSNICNNSQNNPEIDSNKSLHNWVYEFKLFCSFDEIKNLSAFMGSGAFFGCFIVLYFGNTLLPKKAISNITTLMIITLFLFICNIPESLPFLYLCIFIYSALAKSLVIYSYSFLCELSNNQNRSYIFAIVSCAGFFSLITNALLYNFIRHWVYIFIFFTLMCCLLNTIFIHLLFESPRSIVLLKDNFQAFKDCIVNIGIFNGKKAHLIEDEIYKITCENNENLDQKLKPTDDEDVKKMGLTINSIKQIIKNKKNFGNFILFVGFGLFMPCVYSGTSLYLRDYYHSHQHIFYLTTFLEIFVKVFAAFLMNIPEIGRKNTKFIFIGLVSLGYLSARLFQIENKGETENFVYILSASKVCFETVNFINLVHLMESFPTKCRIIVLCIFYIVAQFSVLIFPFFAYHGISNEISWITVIFSAIGIIITYLSDETVEKNLTNFD